MNPELLLTADGSSTLLNAELNATYHSKHGAIQESRHIFIEQGLNYASEIFGKSFHVIEIGLGTGLNALLSAQAAKLHKLQLKYRALEKYPVAPELAAGLNYPELLGDKNIFTQIHSSEWEKDYQLSGHFHFIKHQCDVSDFHFQAPVHCVYFDAFAPDHSPAMWQREIFERLFSVMPKGGCLVTFCAKGEIKRLLKSCGFTVQALPGPPGKREMVRGIV